MILFVLSVIRQKYIKYSDYARARDILTASVHILGKLFHFIDTK